MAKYVVTKNCSYGKRGDLIEISGSLTERQKTMLAPHKEPEVKKLEVATPKPKSPGKDKDKAEDKK